MIMHPRFTFVVVVLLTTGCKYNPASQPVIVTPPPTPVVRVPQENDVWFKINGEDVDRQRDSLNSRAYASIQEDAAPPNNRMLDFEFTTKQVFQGAVRKVAYYMTLYRLLYTPHVYDLSDSNNQRGAFSIDSRQFRSQKGSFEITKIDTSANLISGKFSTIATTTQSGILTDTLTEGYFNNVPISKKSYGQGRVTATINKYSFVSDPPYNLGWIHSYVIRGQNVLHIDIFTTPDGNRTMEFQLPASVKPGTYNLRAAPSDSDAYFHYDSQASDYLLASSDQTTKQKLIITRSDTSSRRLWATFDFSGKRNGDSVTITNGVIDSLLWFRE